MSKRFEELEGYLQRGQRSNLTDGIEGTVVGEDRMCHVRHSDYVNAQAFA